MPPAHAGQLTGYQIHFVGSGRGGHDVRTLAVGTVTHVTLAGLLPGARYTATIAALYRTGVQGPAVAAHPSLVGSAPPPLASAVPVGVQQDGIADTPLVVRLSGRTPGGAGDYVQVSVGPAPAGITVVPLPDTFDPLVYTPADQLPVVRVFTTPRVRPGRYRIPIRVARLAGGASRSFSLQVDVLPAGPRR
jgi:hypothetical protein